MEPVVDRNPALQGLVEENFGKAMEKALGFARSKDAVYLPGRRGPFD